MSENAMAFVALILAGNAYRAAINPPGGVLKKDHGAHNAGESIMAYRHPQLYVYFIGANTVTFMSSMSFILLLFSRLPLFHRLRVWFLRLAIISFGVTYAIGMCTSRALEASYAQTFLKGVSLSENLSNSL